MAEPFDSDLRKKLSITAKKLNLSYHSKATMVTIEGPRFSTRAESYMFKHLGADLINMSTVPEVILANELKIPYFFISQHKFNYKLFFYFFICFPGSPFLLQLPEYICQFVCT